MKKVTKFFMVALLAGMFNLGYAQVAKPDFQKEPKPTEIIIGSIIVNHRTPGWGHRYSDNELYSVLLKQAKETFPDHPLIDIRKAQITENNNSWNESQGLWDYRYTGTALVVEPDQNAINIEKTNNNLSQALSKALRNVREGSRLAIDQVTVIGSMDRENLKDQLIDILLDKGYKVVAKEYLERLYEEQQNQQSGIYNDRTTVQTDNFSAVGYYINVKVTETSLRVQVVNVSTGEYEGNATINF